MTLAIHPMPGRQRGMTLIVGLILLVLMTLFAISAFHMGAVQTVVVANAQQKARGVAAAQMAIDTVLSSSTFTTNPTAAIVSNCTGGGTNSLCVSSNGGTVKDFTVTLTPTPACVSAAPIPASQLNLTAGAASPDIGCLAGQQQGQFAVAGATTGGTICANSVWEINAKAVDSTTNTTVTVTQGAGRRILTAQMATYCPE